MSRLVRRLIKHVRWLVSCLISLHIVRGQPLAGPGFLQIPASRFVLPVTPLTTTRPLDNSAWRLCLSESDPRRGSAVRRLRVHSTPTYVQGIGCYEYNPHLDSFSVSRMAV